MSVINYPDGSSLTSNAQTDAQIQTALQIATGQMLGFLTSPKILNCTLTLNSNIISIPSTLLIYPGEVLTGSGIPSNTTIVSINTETNTITINNQATQSGLFSLTFMDTTWPSIVRIGWQQQGQPGPSIGSDTINLWCESIDSDYSRLRDSVVSNSDDGLIYNKTDVFTRCWKTHWTLYGPNALDNSRAIRSALQKLAWVDMLLAQNNLYVQPSITEPKRIRELFQGQWWERVDLDSDFNEEITEVFSASTVASVEVSVQDSQGNSTDFIVTS